MKNADNPDSADQATAGKPADTASTPSTTTDPIVTRPATPLAAAVFPAMASDRAWDQPSALDLLDLADAAVRRLETVTWLIGEGGARGVSSPSMREVVGIAELLEDISVALRWSLTEMERQQGRQE